MQVVLRVNNIRGVGTPPSIYTEDVINIDDLTEAAARRTALNQFVFGPSGATTLVPATTLGISDPAFNSMPNLESIDRHIFTMEYGIQSVVYHFNAITPLANKMVIYHHGHFPTLSSGSGYETIAAFIAADYDVAAFEMPAFGKNNQPTICPPGQNCFVFNDHNLFALFSPTTGHSIRFLVEPVIAWLNYASVGFSDFYMVGLSGGGWTTTVAAAMDARIDKSFQVAGSMPLYARIPADYGDWEQNVAALYISTMNYSEMYVMGAIPSPRFQMQILNINDSCCFASDGSAYKTTVANKVTALGSTWEFWQETTVPGQHVISPAARTEILSNL